MTSGYGEKKATSWVNCTLWGKQAESLAPYLKKGSSVAITGELELRNWTDKNGKMGSNLEVRVGSVTLIGGKKSDDSAGNEPRNVGSDRDSVFDDMEDSIPF